MHDPPEGSLYYTMAQTQKKLTPVKTCSILLLLFSLPAFPSGAGLGSSALRNPASKPPLDAARLLGCFTRVPDESADCQVSLYLDLPVDNDPAFVFNIPGASTGHCFLMLRKSGKTGSVSRVFGFTCAGIGALSGYDVPGKLVDNSGHKFNAELDMRVSASEFGRVTSRILTRGSSPRYNLWNGNCVHYALDLINALRPEHPILPPNPGTMDGHYGVGSVQALYILLAHMKASGQADGEDIKVGVVDYAPISSGTCG